MLEPSEFGDCQVLSDLKKSRLPAGSFVVPPLRKDNAIITAIRTLSDTSNTRNVGASLPISSNARNSAPQESRSGDNHKRVGSWAIPVPEGAYAAVTAWETGAGWFDALMDALNTQAGYAARAGLVSVGTLLAVARTDWLAADVDTGRGVATAHETVATQLGMSKRQVQRARSVIEALGFAVTIVYGRYLTTEERDAAQQTHGGAQLRAASVRALTLPKSRPAVDTVHLPAPRRGDRLRTVLKSSPTRADARPTAAARPKLRTRRRCPVPQDRSPRPLELQRFAGKLVARMPWLARGHHIGAVCDGLHRAGIDSERWSVDALLGTVDRHNLHARVSAADPAQQRDPLGYFLWMLRRAIQPGEETPAEAAARRREQLRAEQAAWRAEAAAQRERMAADDPAETARILAAMRAESAAASRRSRHSFGE